MKVVWKYKLDPVKSRLGPVEEVQSIYMPRNSNVLDVQMKGSEPVLWALVDPESLAEERQFLLVWTGEERSDLDSAVHIGTFQAGPTAWHLFEKFEEIPF